MNDQFSTFTHSSSNVENEIIPSTSINTPVTDIAQDVSLEWVWNAYINHMKRIQSEAVFHTWVLANPITQVRKEPSGPFHVVFSCPTAFHASTLQRSFHHQIIQALDAILQDRCVPQYVVSSQDLFSVPSTPASQDSFNSSTQVELNHQNSAVNPIRKKSKNVLSQENNLFSSSTVQSMAQERLDSIARKVGLRSDYVFDTFAVSTSNEMAHAAATAVAQRPGTAYNPLFLYGGVGVGKTHLMQAIGHYVLNQNQELSILYCTGEEFTNEIVQAIQTKRASGFKDKYRKADVLLIDDIQFIAGKNAVQEEFFHTFNALTKVRKQIVLTSDRPPQEITLLEDRLRSRFEAGLMIDIQQPTFELRTAIVLVKAKAQQLSLNIDQAKMIATHIDSARKIEGIITILRSEVELKKQPLTNELVGKILSQEKPTEAVTHFSAGEVIKVVANHFHITQTALKGKSRVKHLVSSRHLCMYILKKDCHLPLTEIAKWFSNRDHTSVLHAIRKTELDLKTDFQLQQDLSAIKTTISASAK